MGWWERWECVNVNVQNQLCQVLARCQVPRSLHPPLSLAPRLLHLPRCHPVSTNNTNWVTRVIMVASRCVYAILQPWDVLLEQLSIIRFVSFSIKLEKKTLILIENAKSVNQCSTLTLTYLLCKLFSFRPGDKHQHQLYRQCANNDVAGSSWRSVDRL